MGIINSGEAKLFFANSNLKMYISFFSLVKFSEVQLSNVIVMC